MARMSLFRVLKSIFSGAIRTHFSQYGEDVFLHKKFRKNNGNYFYVDIGAHHPFHLSNTADLWLKKWNGVNIDASKHVIELFEKHRPLDINIATAIVGDDFSNNHKDITFYFSKNVDNCATCDPVIAAERGLDQQETVPCTSLKAIIHQACQRFKGKFGLLNIDIEGLDEQVISEIATWEQLPEVIMIELYGESIATVMTTSAHKILTDAGYIFIQRIGHTCIFEMGNQKAM